MSASTLPRTAAPHQRGAALEELLDWYHNICQAQGRGLFWHNGTQGKIVHGQAILIRSRPDYSGILSALGGRYCAFDAKMTAYLLYRHDRKRLRQLKDLWDVHEAKGIAFLFVSLNLERHFLVWPQPSWAYGDPFSIRLDQLDGRGVEVPRSGGYQLPDYVSILEEVHR